MITRRYHGLLIAALPAPLGRIVMLSHVAEQVTLADGRCVEIGGRERSGDAPGRARHRLPHRSSASKRGLPVWRYDVDGLVIEKRVFLPHMQNTVHVMYELVSTAPISVELALRPSVNFRAAGSRRSASRSAGRTSSAPSATATRSALTDSAAAAAAPAALRPATRRSR